MLDKKKSNNLIKIPNRVSLQVLLKNTVIYENNGKWLYPLFELEDFIEEQNIIPSELYLHDKIAGRAAASLISKMGIKNCYIDLISKPAIDVFEKNSVSYEYSKLVEKIECRTEDLITSDMSLNEVYILLKNRAGLGKGVNLSIKNLNVEYSGNPILFDLNLELNAGDNLIVTGDNGAGKSTLLRSIIGFVKIIKGSIEIDNKSINEVLKPPSIIGYVNQNNNSASFPLTAEEVVKTGLLGSKKNSEEKKYKTEISMRRTGCFHLRKKNFFQLSGGEKQRVSLARCLSQEARLLLLDEPTSFLDIKAKDELVEVLNSITSKHLLTVLLVSHDHEWVKKLSWKTKNLKNGKLC